MRYLIDTSAWARQTAPEVRKALEELYDVGELSFAVPQILELAHGTRSPKERRQLMKDVSRHTVLPVDEHVEDLALEVQGALWEGGLVRAAGGFDILLAAVCIRYDAAMIHYDRDFDHIRQVMPQFRATWVASGLD